MGTHGPILFDGDNVVETGLSKIIDIASGDFRHFEISAAYKEEFYYCMVIIDSKFQ